MLKSLAFLFFLSALLARGQDTYSRTVKLMGSRFDITVVDKDSMSAQAHINTAIEEITRIERLISSWDPGSQTSLINKNAGLAPVFVDRELFDLIARCIELSKATDGAFDISYASLDNIWKFDGSVQRMPDKGQVRASVSKVGFQNIILNPTDQSVFLRTKGMKIGFGAIGKGYAADKAKALLKNRGVTAGIINASGDMNSWGSQPNGQAWQVAITNPMDKNKVFALFPLHNGAVVTSGDYEKFVILDGQRHAHIIDPRTGYPSKGIASVTVFAPRAELADALATSVFVMGKDTGIDRINQIPNTECIVIDDRGRIFTSDNIEIKDL